MAPKKTKRLRNSDAATASTNETRTERKNAKRETKKRRTTRITTLKDGYRVHKRDYDWANSIFHEFVEDPLQFFHAVDITEGHRKGIDSNIRDVRLMFDVAKEDPHCRISKIAMPRSILELPKSLLHLDALEKLVLTAATEIPDWISELRQLRKINMVVRKEDGEILKKDEIFVPLEKSIGNLTNLTEMKIRVNHIPEEISTLTNLQSLEAIDDTVSLPRSIGNLKKLRVLSLSSCRRLPFLPVEIGDLTSLETLNLSGCDDLNSLPRSIGNLKNLKLLNLSNTSMLMELPDEIGNLTCLSELNIFKGGIDDSLPRSIGNLRNLKSLNLGGNEELMNLPDEMWTLTNLEYLNLSDIGFISTCFRDDEDCCNASLSTSIGKLKKLQTLHLGGSDLLPSLPESFGNLTNLKSLTLTVSGITSFPDSFGNLTSLKRLDLKETKLKALPKCIENFTNLEELYCNAVPVHGVPSVLRNSRNLRFLTLNDDDAYREDFDVDFYAESVVKLVQQNPQLCCLGCWFALLCKDLHGALAHNRAKIRLFGIPGQQLSSPRPAMWPLIFARAWFAFTRHHECSYDCESGRFRTDPYDRFGESSWGDSDFIFQLLVRYGADVIESRRPLLTCSVK